MKPKINLSLKQLADVLHANEIKKRPGMPAYAVPRKTFSDKKANKFAAAIIAHLSYLSYMAYRQSTEGRYRPGQTVIDVVGRTRQMKGRFIPAAKVGLGDVTAIIKGKYVSIEIKVGSDRQRPDQKKFEAELKRAGGGYILVHDWAEYLKKISVFC